MFTHPQKKKNQKCLKPDKTPSIVRQQVQPTRACHKNRSALFNLRWYVIPSYSALPLSEAVQTVLTITLN